MTIMDLDLRSIIESSKTKTGLSLSFIIAAILLLLSNLGIDIRFAHISINDMLPKNYVAYVQLYVIVNLISLTITILKKELFVRPKMAIDNAPITPCHNCNNSMDISERKCSECGSIFTYKNQNK